MSADNGLFVLLDTENTGTVVDTEMNAVGEILTDSFTVNPSTQKEYFLLWQILWGQTFYTDLYSLIKEAENKLLQRPYEYGIVLIPVEGSLSKFLKSYCRMVKHQLSTIKGTKEEKQAITAFMELEACKRIFIEEDTSSFNELFATVSRQFFTESNTWNKTWKSQIEEWIDTYRTLDKG